MAIVAVREKQIMLDISGAKVVSVEKGNVESSTIPVFAFTLDALYEDKPVKVIVKDDLAKTLWHNFFSNRGTCDYVFNCEKTKFKIEKEVFITFEADLFEVRAKEAVLKNPRNIVLTYKYELV